MNTETLPEDILSDNKLKKEAKQFAAFISDIVKVMEKHKVENLLAVFGMNEKIRNSYLFTGKEKGLYSFLSDGVNGWLTSAEKISELDDEDDPRWRGLNNG